MMKRKKTNQYSAARSHVSFYKKADGKNGILLNLQLPSTFSIRDPNININNLGNKNSVKFILRPPYDKLDSFSFLSNAKLSNELARITNVDSMKDKVCRIVVHQRQDQNHFR